jgi:hypothetical protein
MVNNVIFNKKSMKKFVFILLIILNVKYSHGQKIMHSYGATVENLVGNVTNRGTTSQAYITQLYGTYFPRYNFIGNAKTSLSIGLPLSIGVALADVNEGQDFGVAFGFDLPIVLDFNFGFKATTDDTDGKKLGGYAGAGFGYNKIAISKTSNSDFTGVSYGPLFRAGIRFGNKKNSSWGEKAVEINFYFKQGLEKQKYVSFGSAVLINL